MIFSLFKDPPFSPRDIQSILRILSSLLRFSSDVTLWIYGPYSSYGLKGKVSSFCRSKLNNFIEIVYFGFKDKISTLLLNLLHQIIFFVFFTIVTNNFIGHLGQNEKLKSFQSKLA